MLTEGVFFDTMRQGLWAAVIISFPVLTAALIAGLTIGLFQALTSIQEMTLTFVPKLAAIALVFWLSMGFMTQTIVNYFQGTVVPLIIGAVS
jgi:flagellar biosynthetic protein FliQ